MPPNWNISKEHIPADWDWFVQVSSPDMVGQVVGHYQITATFNEATNANGQSYRAFDKRTGCAATLKLLSYWLVEDSSKSIEALDLFHREARSVSALNHPNIATVYETGVYDRRAYLATEVFEGDILRQRLKTENVSAEEFIHLGIQLASAMATLHANGMLLRCLYPDIIFVTSAGDAKVLDCGVKYLRDADWDLERPDRHVWLMYIAPEHLHGEARNDARTDLYLLGLVLYELATRHRPFSSFEAFLKQPPAPLADAGHLPSQLTSLILKLLEKEPEDRYQSALEVRDALQQAQ